MNSNLLVISVFLLIVNNVHGASTGQTVQTNGTQVNQTVPFTISLTDFADTFVIFNLTGPKNYSKTNSVLSPSKPFNLTVQIETIKSKESAWIEVVEGFNATYTLVGNANDTAKFSFLVNISPLLPNQKYRFIVKGLYSNKTILYSNPPFLDVTTKALAPQGTVIKQVSLALTGTNAKTYYVQVDKVVRRNILETIINSTISASHTNVTTLDHLNSGTRYSIKLWYMDNNKKVSAVKTIDYVA